MGQRVATSSTRAPLRSSRTSSTRTLPKPQSLTTDRKWSSSSQRALSYLPAKGLVLGCSAKSLTAKVWSPTTYDEVISSARRMCIQQDGVPCAGQRPLQVAHRVDQVV